jgi:transcriptional regulator with XRE-family HTH domain
MQQQPRLQASLTGRGFPVYHLTTLALHLTGLSAYFVNWLAKIENHVKVCGINYMSATTFSERLRQLSDALKIEHQVLARAGGVSKATFSNYIHGEKFPRMETIANWIAKYNVNANWLIAGRGGMFQDGQAAEHMSNASDDPVVGRMQAAVKLLKDANATDEIIQNAILATLETPGS